ADSIISCDNIEVNFTDLSTGFITSWSWVIYSGAGTAIAFSTLTDPSFILTIADLYDVELTVCNPLGCETLLLIDYITLHESPDVSILAPYCLAQQASVILSIPQVGMM
ncbi:MAG: PKD repeat protein, partial [Limisphaerales bacterium]